eukprot:TRINITY_DN7041_c0_g1_i2.p2 TRINITY_DN7041_c0_g1~~TRINITY_DN7041_c0_g1_i2.p2  ORF type:complete len:177 (-),score=27.50 TRINITY_DN7041_c0_g1_i2:81-611(-)
MRQAHVTQSLDRKNQELLQVQSILEAHQHAASGEERNATAGRRLPLLRPPPPLGSHAAVFLESTGELHALLDPRPENEALYSCHKCWTCREPPASQLGPDGKPFYCICDTAEAWGLNDEESDDVEVNDFCNGGNLPDTTTAGCTHNTDNTECQNHYTNTVCTCDASYRWKLDRVAR